jgi:hypothetical protein
VAFRPLVRAWPSHSMFYDKIVLISLADQVLLFQGVALEDMTAASELGIEEGSVMRVRKKQPYELTAAEKRNSTNSSASFKFGDNKSDHSAGISSGDQISQKSPLIFSSMIDQAVAKMSVTNDYPTTLPTMTERIEKRNEFDEEYAHENECEKKKLDDVSQLVKKYGSPKDLERMTPLRPAPRPVGAAYSSSSDQSGRIEQHSNGMLAKNSLNQLEEKVEDLGASTNSDHRPEDSQRSFKSMLFSSPFLQMEDLKAPAAPVELAQSHSSPPRGSVPVEPKKDPNWNKVIPPTTKLQVQGIANLSGGQVERENPFEEWKSPLQREKDLLNQKWEEQTTEILAEFERDRQRRERQWHEEKVQILKKANNDRAVMQASIEALKERLSALSNPHGAGVLDPGYEENLGLRNQITSLRAERDALKQEILRVRTAWQEERNRLGALGDVGSEQVRAARAAEHDEKQAIIRRWKEESAAQLLFTSALARMVRDRDALLEVGGGKDGDGGAGAVVALDMRMKVEELQQEIGRMVDAKDVLQVQVESLRGELEVTGQRASSAQRALLDLKSQLTAKGTLSNTLAEYAVKCAEEKARALTELDSAHQRLETMEHKLQEALQLRIQMHSMMEEMRGAIRVVVRIRPTQIGESGGKAVAPAARDAVVVQPVPGTGLDPKMYEFSSVLPSSCSQSDVFGEVKGLVQSTLDGFNTAVLCYGASGSGKTHTLFGSRQEEGAGILPRVLTDYFEVAAHSGGSVSLAFSVVECLGPDVLDLLMPVPVKRKVRSAGTVEGATWQVVNDPKTAWSKIQGAIALRQVQPTAINEQSSRGHVIITIWIQFSQNGTYSSAKMALVDLAGSENLNRSRSEGMRLQETKQIHKSLAALGDVVAALSAKQSYVPFRNDLLTQLLQDVLGGTSKSILIANVSSASADIQESLATLNFAARIRTVKSQVVKNARTLKEEPRHQ